MFLYFQIKDIAHFRVDIRIIRSCLFLRFFFLLPRFLLSLMEVIFFLFFLDKYTAFAFFHLLHLLSVPPVSFRGHGAQKALLLGGGVLTDHLDFLQVGSLGEEYGHLLVCVHQPLPKGPVVVCSAMPF